jgi:hypothetical protein
MNGNDIDMRQFARSAGATITSLRQRGVLAGRSRSVHFAPFSVAQ